MDVAELAAAQQSRRAVSFGSTLLAGIDAAGGVGSARVHQFVHVDVSCCDSLIEHLPRIQVNEVKIEVRFEDTEMFIFCPVPSKLDSSRGWLSGVLPKGFALGETECVCCPVTSGTGSQVDMLGALFLACGGMRPCGQATEWSPGNANWQVHQVALVGAPSRSDKCLS